VPSRGPSAALGADHGQAQCLVVEQPGGQLLDFLRGHLIEFLQGFIESQYAVVERLLHAQPGGHVAAFLEP
jgi:hypothetical protein